VDDNYAEASVGLKCFKKKRKKNSIFFQVRRSPTNVCDQTKFNNWNFFSKIFSRNQERGLAACQSNPPPDGAVVYDSIHGEGGGMDHDSIHSWSAST
jgi:hypothetical protein